MIFTLCLVLILYIFSMLISVQYDAPALKASSVNAMVLLSGVFSPHNDPGAVSLDRFSEDALSELFVGDETEDSSPAEGDVLVEEFTFSPVAIRFVLSSIDGSFDDREIFYEERSFQTLRQLYVEGRTSIAFTRSENFVRVVDESDPRAARMPGRLVVEVIV